ncbi:extracellular solute-binding protein family 5 [Halorhabdus utahensis DSM 12940]|uniref:Extracellular solute-binding protein family 5 n=1 Tax=Halorhabdus utahensis (strain DSM 12940 / JCM 11049 / AX-2) TaxID=519442 RepID=C7NSD3_HALUD|nr:ABC transporter substrate-binding protein [Halorhabdus utahensis]ACV12020.1 extracellular solute-binding protein family 5 [Halorhabdus utahensis DSM 12940]
MSDKKSQGNVDRRRFMQTVGAGAVAAGVAGCSQSDTTDTEGPADTTEGPDTPPQGGTLTMSLPSSPPSVNVLNTSSSYATAIMDFIWEYGTFLDWTTFEVKPWVYTDWTMENTEGEDPNPDVYFNVRDGLTWSDGEDFTVSDVIFTYEYLLEQEPGKYTSDLKAIDSVEEASGDWDVHLSMNQVVGTYALNQLQLPLLPEHVWSDVDDYTEYQPGQQVDSGGPVGLGMAELTQYEPDTSIELTFRDPDEYQLGQLDWLAEHDTFVQGGPFLDELRYLVYSSESAYVQDFFNDEIDAIYNTLPTGEIQKAREEDRQLVRGGDTGYGFFMFNLRRTPFDDAAFRQALEFLWDDIQWVRTLNQNYVLEGDFIMPPAYEAVRPETETGAEILEDPATNAFEFRGDGEGEPDLETVRSFLTEGQLVTGESGTFAGKDYPGSLTGVTASQSAPRHDYSFGEVTSSVLQDVDGVDQEIRVNGQTITEIRGEPLTYISYPPELVPELTEMDQVYVKNMQELGIPIKRETVGFNALLPRLYAQEDFDVTHLGWGNTSPLGVSSLYNLFHSDNADDHSVVEEGSEQENDQRQLNNNTGYGLFDHAGADDLIDQARRTIDPEERNALVRQAVERIYLDSPYMVYQYSKVFWPLHQRFSGAIENIPGVGGPALTTQMLNIYENE